MNVAMSALVGAGLAAAVVAAPRGDVVRAAGPCEFSGFVVVAKNESGRVVRRQEALDDGQSFGCLYRFGKRIPLDDPRGSVAVVQPRSVRLAGWLAGYALDEAGQFDEGWTDIVVRSLHPRGHLRRRFPAQPDQVQCDDETDCQVPVTDLVLRGKGAVAWIVCPFYVATKKRRCSARDAASIYAAASNAHARERLDMGPDIDIFSLRLSGSTLSWTRAGKTYSSRLD